MMIMALLMRPWFIVMDAVKLQPRVLADDVFLHATGEWHMKAS